MQAAAADVKRDRTHRVSSWRVRSWPRSVEASHHRRSQEADVTLQEVLTEEAETTYAITRNLFQRVKDADLSWKPASGRTEWMSLGQLLMHCASSACGQAARGFVTGEWGFPAESAEPGADAHLPPAAALPSVASVSQALALLEEDRRLTLASIAGTREAELLARRTTAPWGGAPQALFQHLLHVIEHLAQHKGQLFYYLKLMGQEVGTAELWGM
jgi:uncharacterized damage-inducible protein DinB